MKDLFIVAKFTMKDMLKRKSFIISTIIILILIIVGFNVPKILKSIKGDTDGTSKILIVDENNVFEGNLEMLNNMDLGYEFDIQNATYEKIKEEIEAGDIEAAIQIQETDGKINIKYMVENKMLMEGVPTECISALNTIYKSMQISKLGLTQEQLASLEPEFNFELVQTGEEEVKGNVFAMMLLSIALFYAIYFCAYQVSSSITTEKTSKIMETLVTSTKPRTIVLGKTIGIGLVGLLQVLLVIATALISAKLFLEEGMLESIIDVSSITPTLGIITIIYFLLGYLVYALLYALTGSTVSKPEDVQSANGPVAILAVIGFYLTYFTMMNPTSDLNTFASIFPFSSPFCVPFRIMMGVATPTQIAISLAVLVITMLIIAKISIKIYSSAILNYGSKIGIKDIINIYKNKENNI